MKFRDLFLALPLLLLPACSSLHEKAALTAGETAAHYRGRGFAYDYLVYVPGDVERQKEWPAIIFLHGSGERGTNVWLVTKHGPPKILKDKTDFPFIVISPQCPPKGKWDVGHVTEFIKAMKRRYPIDPDRLYLTGLSMGGSGTWNMILAHPEMFAAAVPICGRTDTNALAHLSPKKLDEVRHLPIQIFHGAKDPTVPVKNSEDMFAALEKIGANVKLTVYPDALHDSWTQTYDNPELFKWLQSQNRENNERAER